MTAMIQGHANGFAGAMVTAPKAEPRMGFTSDQRAMIRDTFANGASESEFAVLLEMASARQLNPLLRQIHFVKRWDKEKRRDVWSAQAAIDGLRAIAQRTGAYAGQDEPEFVYDDKGFLTCCKVRVYRKDWTRPSVGIAFWSEYVQTTREGAPTRFWQQMPHVMLAKCAEALALRKAFPEDMSGLYVSEELDHGEEAPAYQPEPVPQLPPARATVDGGKLMAHWFERVDAAETGAALNSVASGVAKAHRDGVITDEQRDRVAAAVKTKRAVLSGSDADGQAHVDAGVAAVESRESGEEG